MAIIQDIRDQLLGMNGLESVDHGPSWLGYRILSDINRAIDAAADANPQAFFQTRPSLGEIIRQQTAVTVSVTNSAKTITVTSGYDVSWMAGCAIMIDSDGLLNRLENEAAGTAPTLDRPFLGSTGSHSATVYHDWIRMPPALRMVMDPVTISGSEQSRYPIFRAQDQTMLDNRWVLPGATWDYWRNFTGLPIPLGWCKDIGPPWCFYEVSRKVQEVQVSGVMLDSLPAGPWTLDYTGRFRTYAPITSLADTRTEILGQDMDQKVLLPMARWFFSSNENCATTQESLMPEFNFAQQRAQEMTIAGRPRKKFNYNPRM